MWDTCRTCTLTISSLLPEGDGMATLASHYVCPRPKRARNEKPCCSEVASLHYSGNIGEMLLVNFLPLILFLISMKMLVSSLSEISSSCPPRSVRKNEYLNIHVKYCVFRPVFIICRQKNRLQTTISEAQLCPASRPQGQYVFYLSWKKYGILEILVRILGNVWNLAIYG